MADDYPTVAEMRQQSLDHWIERAEQAEARVKELEADNAALRDALAGLLTHPGIADMDPRDKDPEDHALERAAREARDSDRPGGKLLAVVEAAQRLHVLVDELCASVDAAGEDVGGHRGSLTILKEIGPADDALGDALKALDDKGGG